ncbi:MAG: ATP synthase F1 subunit gamma [Gemmatimonadetes bacterium 13_1_40CM_2_70_7]|nr:MAG: ATP synthase F1 subunit gamma [Gemmatimonadetes bacterium 13_1_40CM_2_70_7]
MAKARELKRRIRSISSTRQITKTMEMVATSRLKKAQDRVVAARPYAAALAEVIGDLYAPELAERFPLLRRPAADGVGRRPTALVLITSNRGLCGGFNANLIREARRRLQELEGQGGAGAAELHLVGKKGVAYFRFTRRPVKSQRIDIGDRPTPQHAAQLITPLMTRFAQGELDAVEIVFAKFNSPMSTPPTVLRVLPIAPPSATADRRTTRFYILKPSPEAILEALLPLYVNNQMYRALVETAAGEHGARRTAMKNATDSAGDILDVLRRTFNRARQAQITQELAEIVGGAEALKG